jgi:nitroreductase
MAAGTCHNRPERYPDSAFCHVSDPPHPKIARPDHDILDVIRQRWSPRAFDPETPVSRHDLRRVFEAARWAPSSANEQPWRFVVTDRQRSPEAFASLLAALAPRNQAWAALAPVLVLVAVRATFERNETQNALAFYDAGSAVAFLTLQATAIGLHTRQMQGFDPAIARDAVQVPAPFDPAVVMAIGYAGDPETLSHEPQRAAELQPRQRRALAEFVFEDRWGHQLR